MSRATKLLRWTMNSIIFWNRSDMNIVREIETSLLSQSSSHQPSREVMIEQIDKLDDSIRLNVETNRLRRLLRNYNFWIEQNWSLIDVESTWLLVWNVLNYFCMGALLVELLFILLLNPIINTREIDNFNIVSRNLIPIVYLIDMLLVRHRIPILENGKFIKEPQQLLIGYLKKLFLPDLLTIILSAIVIDVEWGWEFFRVLIFLKYLTGKQIDFQIKYKLISLPFLLVVYSFFKFILGLVFWTILYACIYLQIDFNFLQEQGMEYQYGLLWLTGSPSLGFFDLYDNFKWQIWFEYALFFILESMRACGYGIVTPRNPPQFLFANLTMLTTMAMFAYFTKQIIDISVSYSIDKQELLVQATENLRSLQQNYKIDENDTMKYLNQLIRKDRKGENVIEALAEASFSEDLKIKYMYLFRMHFVFASQFLKYIADNNEGQVFTMELSHYIYKKKTYKGEYLYKAGVISQQILYLAEEGGIAMQSQQLAFYKKSKNWQFAGIRQFFIDKKPIFNIISSSTLKLDFLKKCDFWQVLKKYRLILEKYCQEIDCYRINKCSTQKLKIACWLCKRFHLVEYCLLAFKQSLVKFKKQEKAAEERDCLRLSYQRKRMVQQKARFGLEIMNLDGVHRSSEYFVGHNI